MALALSAVVLAPAALGASFTPGSDGLGDPMFPLAGNGGYDVSNYSLTLDYTPSDNRLAGTAVITARATQNLSRFDLDFRMQDSVTRVLLSMPIAKDRHVQFFQPRYWPSRTHAPAGPSFWNTGRYVMSWSPHRYGLNRTRCCRSME